MGLHNMLSFLLCYQLVDKNIHNLQIQNIVSTTGNRRLLFKSRRQSLHLCDYLGTKITKAMFVKKENSSQNTTKK